MDRSEGRERDGWDYAQYIKGWLTRLRSDNKFIIQAASKAQKAADYAFESAAQASETLTIAAE